MRDTAPRLPRRPAGMRYQQLVSSSPVYTYRLAQHLMVSVRMLTSTGGKRNPTD